MKNIILIALIFLTQTVCGQEFLPSEESDPKNFNWMKGFLPAQTEFVQGISKFTFLSRIPLLTDGIVLGWK
ncbi:MAG: hypothetical protein FJ216_09755 [Ignavibacteria bacterium]|nr:hypothetical protein [Ignavibacteria bacterium]